MFAENKKDFVMQSVRDEHIKTAVSLSALLEKCSRKTIKDVLIKVRDEYDAPNQSWIWFIPYLLLGLRTRTAEINNAIHALDKTQAPAFDILSHLFSIGQWKETSVNTLVMQGLVQLTNQSKDILAADELATVKLLLTVAQKMRQQLREEELQEVRCERNDELAKIAQESAAKKSKEILERLQAAPAKKEPAITKKLSKELNVFAQRLELTLLNRVTKPVVNEQPKDVMIITNYDPVLNPKKDNKEQQEKPSIGKESFDQRRKQLESQLSFALRRV